MFSRGNVAFVAFTMVATSLVALTPLATAFTYQGRLAAAGTPASGSYDFEFRLFDAATAGNQVGITIALGSLPVNGGLFTTTLDFGNSPNPFGGQARWLEIKVKPAGGPS